MKLIVALFFLEELLKLKSLFLMNYKIKSYAFVNVFKNIEELTIINGSIEIEKLNMLNHYIYKYLILI